MKYYKLIGGFWPTGYKIGKICPEDWQREARCIIVSKLYRDYPTEWKLSTKAAYNKQEGITVKPKQTKLKQTEMENYSIEGSKALKTAFVEECKLKLYSSSTLSELYLTSEQEPIGEVQGSGTKSKQHFVLPKDWEAAVKYVTEFNTPKVVFKNGDYVVVLSTETYDYGNSCGDTRPIIGEIYLIDHVNYPNELVRLFCTNGNKIAIKAEELRIATSTEIKGIPPIYKTGQKFEDMSDTSEYILAHCEDLYVALINLKSGNLYSNRVKVKSLSKITEKEFEEICGGDDFKLIK